MSRVEMTLSGALDALRQLEAIRPQLLADMEKAEAERDQLAVLVSSPVVATACMARAILAGMDASKTLAAALPGGS